MSKRQRLSVVAFRALQVGVVGLVALTAAGLAGAGPFGWLHRKSNSSATSATAPSTTTRGGSSGRSTTTTSTFPMLESRSYENGQCVTWDQTPSFDSRPTTVEPCAKPHLVEISGHIAPSPRIKRYPTDAYWNNLIDRDCLPSARALLGGHLDPAGRFTVGGIRPLADAWDSGDTTVWCDVQLAATRPAQTALTPFTGKVEGANQTRLNAVGACFSPPSPFAIPCARSHQFEITGYIDLSGSAGPPPAPDDINAWSARVGSRCDRMARTYVGHGLVNDETGGWVPILAGSWAAGRRIVECTITRLDTNNHAIATVGSLRA